ncbi:hypothetical protein PGT21_026728 [Puccinia graminis f. sp. tritici]|uniref:Uncharacterized protein n=1 Tax=Puccinia graminis f. sp. tritici TaxID=56615 RepID=A0A5B0PAD9_PUCGR|nr:hypothetical protein PGT21_026728 [Puccinia graminis f. sp. tritici]
MYSINFYHLFKGCASSPTRRHGKCCSRESTVDCEVSNQLISRQYLPRSSFSGGLISARLVGSEVSNRWPLSFATVFEKTQLDSIAEIIRLAALLYFLRGFSYQQNCFAQLFHLLSRPSYNTSSSSVVNRQIPVSSSRLHQTSTLVYLISPPQAPREYSLHQL